MSDTSSSPGGNWADAWMQMQRQYWDTWSELSKRGAADSPTDGAGPGAAPWSQGLDFWSKLMAPALPGEARTWMDKALEMNKGYVQMGESLWKALSSGKDAGSDLNAWWESVSRAVKEMQQQASSSVSGGTPDSWKGFATLWGLPLDNWNRVTSACSMFPGDMTKSLHEFTSARQGEGLPDFLNGWLSTPTLGYTRESQEEVQRLGQRLLEYQKAMQGFVGVLSGIVARAAELLRDKALERVGKGEAFDSVRECYNLWVDCGEEAYAEVCASDAFTRAQATMTNALMALKHQEQSMIDESLSALNMPTRRELDTSHRRVHRLQRRVGRLEEALEAAGVGALRDEVAALRDEVAALRGTQPSPAAAAAPRRAAKAKGDS